MTVIDMPRNMLINFPQLMGDVNLVLLVCEMTLASARDTIRLLSWLKSNASHAHPMIVANKVQPGISEISRGDFESSIERKIDFVVPYDYKAACNAAKLGQVFVDANRSSKATAAIRQIAERVMGASEEDPGAIPEEKKSLLGNFDVDAGITYLDNEPLGRVTSVPLYSERYQLITAAGNAHSEQQAVTWAEVSRLPLCLLTPDMQNRRIVNQHLAEAGASAFKVSTYEYDAHRFPRIDHPTMLSAFAEIATTGLMVAVHNEDQEMVVKLTEAAKAAGNTSPIWHCRTRPPITETMADLEIFEMALETGAHVHIAHSSLARGFELAKIYRGQGAKTSGEACIQYLCMTEDDIVRLQGFGKCNPPFRTAAEVALRDPAWIAPDRWGGMIELLIADIATMERGRADFPFLRNWDAYEAHTWANGIGVGEHADPTDVSGKFEDLGVVDVVHGQSGSAPLPYIGSGCDNAAFIMSQRPSFCRRRAILYRSGGHRTNAGRPRTKRSSRLKHR